MSEKYSVPSGAFNARVEPEAPKPTKPRSEGPIVPPVVPKQGWISKNTDLPDSTKPAITINVDAIRDSVARTLAAHDRAVAVDNGAEVWRADAEMLERQVRANEISPADAERLFRHLHPTITPEQLRGQS